jgi:hypothetical protein
MKLSGKMVTSGSNRRFWNRLGGEIAGPRWTPCGSVSNEGFITGMLAAFAKPLATKNTTTHNATFVVRAAKVSLDILCVDKPIYYVDGSLCTKRLNVSFDDEN